MKLLSPEQIIITCQMYLGRKGTADAEFIEVRKDIAYFKFKNSDSFEAQTVREYNGKDEWPISVGSLTERIENRQAKGLDVSEEIRALDQLEEWPDEIPG